MRRWQLSCWLISLLLVCFFLAACGNPLDPAASSKNGPESIRVRGKLVAAVSVYPPFVYRDLHTQRLVGYDIEMAYTIAKKMNVPLEIKEVQFTSLIPAVQNGQADLALGALYITPARKALVDFSIPYLETGIVLVTKKRIEDAHKELDGKAVGVKTGGASEKIANDLKNKHMNIVIKRYREAAEYLQDLEDGRIDAALNDLLNQLEYNKTHKGLIIGEGKLSNDALGIAVQRENMKLLEIVNDVIAEMKQDGTSVRLYHQWLDTAAP